MNPVNPIAPNPNPLHCAECESLLTDSLDGLLTPEQQAAMDQHLSACPACATLFAEAQRGAALLELLHAVQPEPPAGLYHRILAQTSETATPAPSFGRRLRFFAAFWIQPRPAMTAAMAFFSIALSMNLLGLHLGDLRPGRLQRTFYRADARFAQFYDGLGIVEQMQSRMQQEEQPSNPAPAPEQIPKQPTPDKPGSSRRETPDPRRDFAQEEARA